MDPTIDNAVRQMAAAPLQERKPEKTTEKPRKAPSTPFVNLGAPVFSHGDGKIYPRTTGWGKDRKPHPDGGTNQTIAWVAFKPFTGEGSSIELLGRVYLERFTENGKKVALYSVSLPFLKADRKDASGRVAIQQFRDQIAGQFRTWREAHQNDQPEARKEHQNDGSWREEETE